MPMLFEDLIQIKGTKASPPPTAKIPSRPKRSKGIKERGCDVCPSKANWKYGIDPVMGKVKGKDIFIWAQCPGFNENLKGKELIGKAGKLLWGTLESVGITREMCDVQNVVRCFSSDPMENGEYMKMRNPNKEELRCCSVFTEQALEKSKAKVHIVLGLIAQKQLLGKEYKKGKSVFYSDTFKAWIVCAAHPSFFLRMGGTGTKEWRQLLSQAANLAKATGGRYGYLKRMDYKAVVTAKEARRADREIRHDLESDATHRLSVDFEEGLVTRHSPSTDGTGQRTALVLGFSPTPKKSRVFWLDHPDLPKPRTERDKKVVRKIARKLVEDASIAKTFHKGNYDTEAIWELCHWYVENYDYDTEFGEYFAYPNAYAYGLLSIANRRFPQMAGYKEIILPESLRTDWLEKQPKIQEQVKQGTADYSALFLKTKKESKAINLALLPWKKMLLYNGGDADLQKRVELTTYKRVKLPLMYVYIDAGFVLSRMERYDSPLFDYKHHKLLSKLYPIRRDRTLEEIRKQVKQILTTTKPAKVLKLKKDEWHVLNKDSWRTFNPGSHLQVKDIIYNYLKLPVIETKDNKDRVTGEVKPKTDKTTLDLLAPYHKLPALIVGHHHDSKVCSTYLNGFIYCANANSGRLKTKWWLTGASSGRTSSGGGGKRRAEEELSDVVNLQNVIGDANLQCLLISDKRWRKVYRYWLKHGPFKADVDIPKWVYAIEIFLGSDEAQMELRLLAEKSGDPELIRIFSNRKSDPHSEIGHELTGWPIEKIKKNAAIRRKIKGLHFGIVYGLLESNLFDYMVAFGAYKYSDGTPEGNRLEKKHRNEVVKFLHKYFERFKGVEKMIDADHQFVEEHKYVETLFGFRRPISDIQTKGSIANISVNTPLQGSANQLMLMGIAALQRKPLTYKLIRHLQMIIHDAGYWVVKLRSIWKAAKLTSRLLEKEPIRRVTRAFKMKWKTPLVAEPKAGYRFGVMIDITKMKGENKTSQLLNQWCEENQKLQRALRKELKEAA